MKTRNKTRLLLLLTGLLFCMSSYAQDSSYIKGRWTVNLGLVPDIEYFDHGFYPRHQFMLSTHYGFGKYLEVGGFCGTSKYIYMIDDYNSVGMEDKILYGLSAKAHLLPIVIDAQDFRFDIYLNTRIGVDHYPVTMASGLSQNTFRFHGGAGLAFYPFKHLGAFTEYGYNNHGIIDYLDNWSWEFGVVYKFRRKR